MGWEGKGRNLTVNLIELSMKLIIETGKKLKGTCGSNWNVRLLGGHYETHDI